MRRFSLVLTLLVAMCIASDALPKGDKGSSKERRFVSPATTILEPASTDTTSNIEGAQVTFRLKCDQDGTITALELDTCTSSDTSFIVTAREAIKSLKIDPLQLMFLPKAKWFYHTVVFRPRWADNPNDSLERPDDTVFIPVDVQPEMIYEEAPIYPKSAKGAGVSGTVWVKALVGTSGKVHEVKVARTSGSPALDSSAVQAAYRNRFNPAARDGKPVAIWVTYKVEYRTSR